MRRVFGTNKHVNSRHHHKWQVSLGLKATYRHYQHPKLQYLSMYVDKMQVEEGTKIEGGSEQLDLNQASVHATLGLGLTPPGLALTWPPAPLRVSRVCGTADPALTGFNPAA